MIFVKAFGAVTWIRFSEAKSPESTRDTSPCIEILPTAYPPAAAKLPIPFAVLFSGPLDWIPKNSALSCSVAKLATHILMLTSANVIRLIRLDFKGRISNVTLTYSATEHSAAQPEIEYSLYNEPEPKPKIPSTKASSPSVLHQERPRKLARFRDDQKFCQLILVAFEFRRSGRVFDEELILAAQKLY